MNKSQDKINQILKTLFAHYQDREYQLIKLLYLKGVTQTEIANALEVSQEAIAKRYPLKGKEVTK